MEVRERIMTSIKVFDSVVISAGGEALSEVINLPAYASVGYYSLEIKIEGSGTVNVDYLSSNNKDSSRVMLKPEGEGYIITGATATNGNQSDGTQIINYSSIASIFKQIRATETGGVSTATITGYLCIVGMG